MSQPKIERLVKMAYEQWKPAVPSSSHPDDETLASFLEHKLDKEAEAHVQMHLLRCKECAEMIVAQLGALREADSPQPSSAILERARASIKQALGQSVLEVLIKAKNTFLELVSTSADVLVGQEVIPATVLRSRHINEFKDEVVIFKDFKDIRVEMRIAQKAQGVFEAAVTAKNKLDQTLWEDVRLTLIRDGCQLESYQNDTGKACFQQLKAGKYIVEIQAQQELKASVILEIST